MKLINNLTLLELKELHGVTEKMHSRLDRISNLTVALANDLEQEVVAVERELRRRGQKVAALYRKEGGAS